MISTKGTARSEGSSPRVRGKPRVPGDRRQHGRLIPARAGKTSLTSARTFLRAAHPRAGKTGAGLGGVGEDGAHPRACGENGMELVRAILAAGSSPRVRGKPGRGGPRPDRRGLIPARAGKTTTSSSRGTRSSAHPRACGENGPGDSGGETRCGSSPRVRGKHHGRRSVLRRLGLIPARAGKTACTSA